MSELINRAMNGNEGYDGFVQARLKADVITSAYVTGKQPLIAIAIENTMSYETQEGPDTPAPVPQPVPPVRDLSQRRYFTPEMRRALQRYVEGYKPE